MAKKLPARPNLDHLRNQAKQLLARKKGKGAVSFLTRWKTITSNWDYEVDPTRWGMAMPRM